MLAENRDEMLTAWIQPRICRHRLYAAYDTLRPKSTPRYVVIFSFPFALLCRSPVLLLSRERKAVGLAVRGLARRRKLGSFLPLQKSRSLPLLRPRYVALCRDFRVVLRWPDLCRNAGWFGGARWRADCDWNRAGTSA